MVWAGSNRIIIIYTIYTQLLFSLILLVNWNGTLVLYNIMKGYYESKPLTAEQIITSIDPKFGSRNAVLNLIKKSEKKGIISRITSKQDKREKVIIPSKGLIESHKKMLGFILNS